MSLRMITAWMIPLMVVMSLLPEGSFAGQDYPRVYSVQIGGNRVFTKRQIRGWMVTQRGDPFRQELLERDLKTILEHYREAGHLLAEVEVTGMTFSGDSSRVDLTLEVAEGPLLRVDRIEVVGNHLFAKQQLLAGFDTRPGQPFRERVLEEDLEGLLTLYEDNGYPYCRVRLADFQIEGEEDLSFRLEVEEGPRVIIEGIEVEGNEITRDYVVTRELGIRPGDLYRQRRIDRGYRRLEQLGFFERVYPPRIGRRRPGDQNVLVLGVEEAKMNTASGMLGYNPVPEGEGYFTGLMDLSFQNLFGTGRGLEAHWSRTDPYSSRLRFAYLEPWMLGTPLNLELELEQVDQDTSYVLTSLQTRLRLPLFLYLDGYLGLDWERVDPDPREGLFLARSRKLSGILGLEVDTRDNRFNPRRGVHYRADIAHGLKRNWATPFFTPLQGRVESTRLSMDLEHFLPTRQQQVLAIGLHGRQIRSEEEPIPLSEQFRLGGTTTLRGYREEQFTGSRVAWSNLEYRFLLGKRSRVFPFLDLGYYSRQVRDPLTGDLHTRSGGKLGYGLGLRLSSRLGLVGLDYGLGWGDSPMEGKLHFGVQNEF